MNKIKKSPEHRVRIKVGLIFLVIILYFTGLFIYTDSLKKNMDIRKEEMNNSYGVLTRSNQLIISIQQAQDILNMYLETPRRSLQQQYDSISTDISLQIHDIKFINPEKEQDILLQDIDSLLQEKNRIVRLLTGLFRTQSPLSKLDQKIDRYDEIIKDSVVVTTNIDTTRVEKTRRGFWNRLRNVFDPGHAPDTTINITRIEQESWSGSRIDTTMYADLKNISEEASRSYSSHIQGIERRVRELLFAEQNISRRIAQLTHEFYNETIQTAWMGIENSEKLTRRIFEFAILVGTVSILFILIIIFFIINDLNKGQKARVDLAREKQLTEELIESRHKLLLSVSHDVKTPLSSMMGYMEMWDSDETDADKKRQLQSARNSGKHILNMLTNLLEFSRLQQKSETLHVSRFNLIELMEDTIRMFQPFTEEKKLSITFENLAPSPLYVETDHTLLKQILTNVVSNAVKYTIRGGVSIRLHLNDELVFTVTDTGIGMDAGELPELFKPFSRMQSPLKTEGSGFGMYVTKGLLKLLKGKIMISSEKGKGTSITITLPIGQADLKAVPGEGDADVVAPGGEERLAPDGMSYNKILIFEDDLSLGNMIREYLARNGYNAQLCSNSQDVKGFMNNIALFDIIFTDMQMTGITGTDILREIRKRDVCIPVWLMTANDDYTTEKAVSDGFSGFITKPIRMDKLLGIVSGKSAPENPAPQNRIPEQITETESFPAANSDRYNRIAEQVAAGNSAPENGKPEAADNIFRDKFPQLVALFGNDTQTIRDILAGFVQSSLQDTDRLQELTENGAFEEAQQLCHKIYPFLCQLDAEYLCTALRQMDLLRGEDETAFPDWKEALNESIKKLREFTEMIRKSYL